MKHLIPVVLLVSLAVVGCKSKNSSPPPTASTPTELTPPPAPAPAPAPVPDYTPAPQPTAAAPAPTPVDKKVTPAKTEAKVTAPKTSTAGSSKSYLVKKGDTLSEIAAAHKTTVKKIMNLNPEIKDADAIYVGQKLKMP